VLGVVSDDEIDDDSGEALDAFASLVEHADAMYDPKQHIDELLQLQAETLRNALVCMHYDMCKLLGACYFDTTLTLSFDVAPSVHIVVRSHQESTCILIPSI
jgi:hypothetical protein